MGGVPRKTVNCAATTETMEPRDMQPPPRTPLKTEIWWALAVVLVSGSIAFAVFWLCIARIADL